jgi:hypothetical protein
MEQVQRQSRRPRGLSALGWAAFVVIVMLATAAIIAGTIKTGLTGPAASSSSALPSLSGPPAPAPTPLPKPGGAPPRTEIAAL